MKYETKKVATEKHMGKPRKNILCKITANNTYIREGISTLIKHSQMGSVISREWKPEQDILGESLKK